MSALHVLGVRGHYSSQGAGKIRHLAPAGQSFLVFHLSACYEEWCLIPKFGNQAACPLEGGFPLGSFRCKVWDGCTTEREIMSLRRSPWKWLLILPSFVGKWQYLHKWWIGQEMILIHFSPSDHLGKLISKSKFHLFLFIFSLKAKWGREILECCSFLWGKAIAEASVMSKRLCWVLSTIPAEALVNLLSIWREQDRDALAVFTRWDISFYVYFLTLFPWSVYSLNFSHHRLPGSLRMPAHSLPRLLSQDAHRHKEEWKGLTGSHEMVPALWLAGQEVNFAGSLVPLLSDQNTRSRRTRFFHNRSSSVEDRACCIEDARQTLAQWMKEGVVHIPFSPKSARKSVLPGKVNSTHGHSNRWNIVAVFSWCEMDQPTKKSILVMRVMGTGFFQSNQKLSCWPSNFGISVPLKLKQWFRKMNAHSRSFIHCLILHHS